jgi:membrane associated rhomboid family serine protease
MLRLFNTLIVGFIIVLGVDIISQTSWRTLIVGASGIVFLERENRIEFS